VEHIRVDTLWVKMNHALYVGEYELEVILLQDFFDRGIVILGRGSKKTKGFMTYFR